MSVADRLYRRVQMMLAPVKITATDDTGPVHRAQVRAMAPEQIDNVSVLQLYGLASHAMVGSDAMALFVSGDRSNAVIVATNNQQYRLRNLNSGEVALYDNGGNVVKLANGGNIEITCPGSITITCPLVKLTGDLHVTGEIVRGFGTGDQVTLGQHSHTQGGDSHGDSEAPTNPPTPGT
jgi:phage gp45-like